LDRKVGKIVGSEASNMIMTKKTSMNEKMGSNNGGIEMANANKQDNAY
jgi:hypothetical protein